MGYGSMKGTPGGAVYNAEWAMGQKKGTPGTLCANAEWAMGPNRQRQGRRLQCRMGYGPNKGPPGTLSTTWHGPAYKTNL